MNQHNYRYGYAVTKYGITPCDHATMRKQATIAKWQARIKAQESSGLSVSNWCAKNNVAEVTLYTWKKRLRELLNQAPEIKEETPPEVINTLSNNDSTITAKDGKIELIIHNGADAATVEAVLKAIAS